jgi:DNA-binding response OmpR family regulator
MYNLLCVQDSQATNQLLSTVLKDYVVHYATTAMEADALLLSNAYSLVILDIGLPDGSGLDIFTRHENKLANTPVIFLSAKTDIESKSCAFSLGAEDFIEKPFNPLELSIRIKARLNKIHKKENSNKQIQVGSVACNIPNQCIEFKNTKIKLTFIELRIFQLLATNPNTVFTRTSIIQKIWGDKVYITDRTVDVHISNLRKKISASDVLIEGVVGSGYRLLTAHN